MDEKFSCLFFSRFNICGGDLGDIQVRVCIHKCIVLRNNFLTMQFALGILIASRGNRSWQPGTTCTRHHNVG